MRADRRRASPTVRRQTARDRTDRAATASNCASAAKHSSDFLVHPTSTWDDVVTRLPELATVSREAAEQVVNDVKYAGYVERQELEIARIERLAEKRIPASFDFAAIKQLRTEAREKLTRIRPASLAQAARISGITPADLALVRVYLE
ncbi:MAG: hypothetical protein QM775_36480 [Pirellulales bacterium]